MSRPAPLAATVRQKGSALLADSTSLPAGILSRVSLGEEIARFAADVPSGRRSITLLKTPTLRVVLVTMRAGTELHEHTAPAVITMQGLQGRLVVTLPGEELALAPGDLIALREHTHHAVRAVEDGAFLLTIAWSGQSPEDGDTSR
jgi:quercetin dioxygenase-like cupin family protein